MKDFIKQAKSVKSGAPVRAVLVNQTDVCTGEWSQLFDVFSGFVHRSSYAAIEVDFARSVQGDCDSFVQRTTELWKKRRPEDFLSQQRMFALGTKSGKSTVVAASLAKPKPTPSKRNKPTSVSKKLDERAKNSK